jgi:hypothetical protein
VSPGKSPNEKSHSLDALKSSQKKGHFMFWFCFCSAGVWQWELFAPTEASTYLTPDSPPQLSFNSWAQGLWDPTYVPGLTPEDCATLQRSNYKLNKADCLHTKPSICQWRPGMSKHWALCQVWCTQLEKNVHFLWKIDLARSLHELCHNLNCPLMRSLRWPRQTRSM